MKKEVIVQECKTGSTFKTLSMLIYCVNKIEDKNHMFVPKCEEKALTKFNMHS